MAHQLLNFCDRTLIVYSTSTQPTAGTPLHACSHIEPYSAILREVPTLQVRLRSLPLHLVQEVEVRLVEVVHAHISVLSSAAVAGTLWVYGDVVEGTEVTTHTTDFLRKNFVVKAGLEFSLPSRCSGNVHST
jgi:hypothetical protein